MGQVCRKVAPIAIVQDSDRSEGKSFVSARGPSRSGCRNPSYNSTSERRNISIFGIVKNSSFGSFMLKSASKEYDVLLGNGRDKIDKRLFQCV